jgi:hypothetical protein
VGDVSGTVRRLVACLICVAGAAHAQPGAAEPSGAAPATPPELFQRRPSDERLFLSPTELAMQPGSVVLEDDVVISARLAVGVARWLQLDLRIGGVLVPGAVGGALAFPGGIAAGGGAGFVLLGLVDVGAKVPVLRETSRFPGIAIGYDLVDVFGVAAGGAGIVLVGAGAAGAGIVAVGGANLQFNLFSLAAGKHFGRAHVTAGTYILDNHHFITQSASFAAACGAGGVGSAGAGGKVEPCASGGTMIDRVPLQVQPFVGIERAVGRDSSIAAEILFSGHIENTIGATGVRWVALRRGPLRARLDLALLWSRVGYPLPWAGLGVHFR